MIYAISDIHGCFDQYRKMLETIGFSPKDTLYVLGDVLDRGPDGIRILQDMSVRPNVLPILGNHEFTAALCIPWLLEEITDESIASLDKARIAALSEWIANGGKPTLRALRQLGPEERRDILDCLQEMELYAEVEAGGRSFVLVHAGLEHFAPEKPLSSYQVSDYILAHPDMDADCFPNRFLVFGHIPVRNLRRQCGLPPSDEIFRRGNRIAIDCGCSLEGGRLGCLCLDTLEEFYV